MFFVYARPRSFRHSCRLLLARVEAWSPPAISPVHLCPSKLSKSHARGLLMVGRWRAIPLTTKNTCHRMLDTLAHILAATFAVLLSALKELVEFAHLSVVVVVGRRRLFVCVWNVVVCFFSIRFFFSLLNFHFSHFFLHFTFFVFRFSLLFCFVLCSLFISPSWSASAFASAAVAYFFAFFGRYAARATSTCTTAAAAGGASTAPTSARGRAA